MRVFNTNNKVCLVRRGWGGWGETSCSLTAPIYHLVRQPTPPVSNMTDITLRSRKRAGPETRLSTLREPFPASISYAKPREALLTHLWVVYSQFVQYHEELFS